jgi:S1-C subfamily serine protease
MITASGLEVLEVIRVGDLDACVLVTEPHNREPWPLADRIPLAGERVFKSGYGAGEHWWTEGIATEDADRIAIDIFHGDSGGPLFDAQGNVLGVIVSMGGYGYEGRILHHARIVPMALILAAMPEGLLEGLELPHGPLPVGETPWERFL